MSRTTRESRLFYSYRRPLRDALNSFGHRVNKVLKDIIVRSKNIDGYCRRLCPLVYSRASIELKALAELGIVKTLHVELRRMQEFG